jgi:hypothetical protein
MSGDFVSANIDNLDELLAYENNRLKDAFSSEIERSLARWSSRWRQESMEHYLKAGWSFLLRNREDPHSSNPEGTVEGYFLAQPLLFLDGQTQSLWVEHISYSSLDTRDRLCDFAYRLSREKHFQKVYFPSQNSVLNSINSFNATAWAPEVYQVLTTKVQV